MILRDSCFIRKVGMSVLKNFLVLEINHNAMEEEYQKSDVQW